MSLFARPTTKSGSRRNLSIFVAGLLIFVVCVFVLLQTPLEIPGTSIRYAEPSRPARPNADSESLQSELDQPIEEAKQKQPKITIIAIWSINKPEAPPYLPLFFQSVEQNPQIDFLLIEVDRAGFGCTTYSTAPNVNEVCLSVDDYYRLHVDFLCKKWQCSDSERDDLLTMMKEDARRDKNNSFFRILRNGVFGQFMDPSTTLWGWTDFDVFYGNFERKFPWDLADDFDIYIASSQPDYRVKRLLFTRGHMAFFRNTPDVLEKMHAYPKFASLDNYLTLPPTTVDAEESEFSHYMFAEESAFTFLDFEGMADSRDTLLLSPGTGGGVFYTFETNFKPLTAPEKRGIAEIASQNQERELGATFSREGVETAATIRTEGSEYGSPLWFDLKWATYVETGWNTHEEKKQKAFFMRRKPHGPLSQRLEPRQPTMTMSPEGIFVDEALYKHWQSEKYDASWFKDIPHRLWPGELLLTNGMQSAEIWNAEGVTTRHIGS